MIESAVASLQPMHGVQARRRGGLRECERRIKVWCCVGVPRCKRALDPVRASAGSYRRWLRSKPLDDLEKLKLGGTQQIRDACKER